MTEVGLSLEGISERVREVWYREKSREQRRELEREWVSGKAREGS